MFHNFAGTTADEVWRYAARALIDDESLPWQMSRAGKYRRLVEVSA